MTAPVVITLPAAPVKGPLTLDLQDALYAWATAVVPGVPVIWADQSGTKPLKPFISLNMMGPIKRTGIDWVEQNGEATGSSHTYMVTVQAYTNAPSRSPLVLDASQFISDLVMGLDDPYLSDTLSQAGIGIGPVNSPHDLSELLDTKFERRIAFDFEANVMAVWPLTNPQTIETVPTPTGTLVP